MATVEDLYKAFGVLADANDKAGEHPEEYKKILGAVKGGASEKRLASQFIPRFFKYFPDLAEQAIDAQLDLCEDDNTAICKAAIKELPSFCRDFPEHLPRISDILTQLLQSENAAELNVVQTALLTLFKTDPKGALGGLFSQILQGEDVVREHAIRFMLAKLPGLIKDVFNKDVEEYLVTESKKVLQDVTGDEFVAFMKILASCPSMQSLQGRQSLVDIITEQAELDAEFLPSDPDCVDKLIACIRQAMPLFSKNVQTTKFVDYMCDHVIEVLSEVSSSEHKNSEKSEEDKEEKGDSKPDSNAPEVQLDILKLFAEMSMHCGDLEGIEGKLLKVYNKLVEYMPPPPSEEDGENTTPNEDPKLQFSHVECLMFAFHQLARKHASFLTDEDNAVRLKDFRIRLQYFARGVQVYIKQLRAALQGKTGDVLREEENKIKVVALKITNNINTLIKDLFHNPPSYKATVTLSWKPIQRTSSQSTPTAAGNKRSGITPISYANDAPKKISKQDRKIYSPPTGKWSDTAGHYQPGRGRGFRGGFGRGRGRGFGRFY